LRNSSVDSSSIKTFVEKNSTSVPSTASSKVEVAKNAYKDVLKESELEVKIADLGNACWTVRIEK
jgi:hypothetical protein